jgi:hypothetical protein
MREIPSRLQVLRKAVFMRLPGTTSELSAALARLDYRLRKILRTVAQRSVGAGALERDRSMISAARRALSRRLAGHERRRLDPPARLTYGPLFVISLPRSGSTLLYQLLLQRFRLAYFSNLMAAFPESPVTIAAVSDLFGGQSPPDDLASTFGYTRGWNAPNQAGGCGTAGCPNRWTTSIPRTSTRRLSARCAQRSTSCSGASTRPSSASGSVMRLACARLRRHFPRPSSYTCTALPK